MPCIRDITRLRNKEKALLRMNSKNLNYVYYMYINKILFN